MTKLEAQTQLKKNQKVLDTIYKKNGTDEKGFDNVEIDIEKESKHIFTHPQYQYTIIELLPLHPEYIE